MNRLDATISRKTQSRFWARDSHSLRSTNWGRAEAAHQGWNQGSGSMGARPGVGIEPLFSFLSYPQLGLQRRGRGQRTEPSPAGKGLRTPPPRDRGLPFLTALGDAGSTG